MGRGRGRGREIRRRRGRERLEGYRRFIDDWEAFQAHIQRPEPTTLRTNLRRVTREELADRLREQGYQVEEIPHLPAFLEVEEPPERPVSDTLEHWSGLFYMQQTATGLAAPLLAPEPGERVLDMCAAPGGKTTHLAELMDGRGSVVAADVNETRIRALLGNIYRLGHANVLTIAGDARRLPTGVTFDRVLVDVPCSAEGTLRKRGGEIPGHSAKWTRQVTRAQEKLLRRAVRLTRPGGTILYVTCTFGPEENEAVLTRVLADGGVAVDPLRLPVPHAPGLTRDGDEAFHPSLEGAARIYPHHLDSGGLFLCRLRKEGPESPGATVGWTPVPAVFPGDEVPADQGTVDGVEHASPEVERTLERALAFLEQELGVEEEALESLKWMRRGTNVWAHRLSGWPVEHWSEGGHWRVVATGFRALDLGGDGPPRPTNDLIGWLGKGIHRQRVDLTPTEWIRLLAGRQMELDGPDGLVALALDGVALARGFRRDGVLRHEVPKGRLRWLRSVMEGREGDED